MGFYYWVVSLRASLVAQNLPAMQETGLNPWVRKIPWRREWQSTPVFLPGKSHRQRSLAGYSPWGRKKSDTTKRLTHLLSTGCDQWLCWGKSWMDLEECKLKTRSSTGLSCPNAALREGRCYLCRNWTGERLSPLDQYHLGAGEGHTFITPSGSEKFYWAVEVTRVSYRLCKPGDFGTTQGLLQGVKLACECLN